jgi:hypothetical protein
MTEDSFSLPPLPDPSDLEREARGADIFDFTLTRNKARLSDINPAELRKDKAQIHNHQMEKFALGGLLLAMVSGVIIFIVAPNGNGATLGTALITGPLGAFSTRFGSSASRSKEDS